MQFQGWPARTAGPRMVGHGGPEQYFRESMATPCQTPMFLTLMPTYLEGFLDVFGGVGRGGVGRHGGESKSRPFCGSGTALKILI
jgi:hypothetical protein